MFTTADGARSLRNQAFVLRNRRRLDCVRLGSSGSDALPIDCCRGGPARAGGLSGIRRSAGTAHHHCECVRIAAGFVERVRCDRECHWWREILAISPVAALRGSATFVGDRGRRPSAIAAGSETPSAERCSHRRVLERRSGFHGDCGARPEQGRGSLDRSVHRFISRSAWRGRVWGCAGDCRALRGHL